MLCSYFVATDRELRQVTACVDSMLSVVETYGAIRAQACLENTPIDATRLTFPTINLSKSACRQDLSTACLPGQLDRTSHTEHSLIDLRFFGNCKASSPPEAKHLNTLRSTTSSRVACMQIMQSGKIACKYPFSSLI